MAASAPALRAAPARVDRRGMTVVSAGHALADCAQGAVPALLPFLVAANGWSYAQASALILAATVASSVVQPLFGLVADRRALGWLLPAGPLLAGVGVGLAGVAPGYWPTFLAVVLSGLGVAAFHPEGSRFANYLSGARRATGMSLFSVGGNAGFALGPVLVTPVVLLFGLEGTLLLCVPAVLGAAWITAELPRLEGFRPTRVAPPRDAAGREARAREEDWPAFVRLNLVIAARTFAYFGLVTFIPLYYVDVLGQSSAAGNTALALYLAGGAVGTLIGGPLADRLGRRPVVIGSLALLCPLVLLFHAASPPLATALLFAAGACTIASFSIVVVMGQEYLPTRIGLASGVTLGLAIGLGGVGAPLLGLLADARGLDATMTAIAILPLVGVAVALTLPRR